MQISATKSTITIQRINGKIINETLQQSSNNELKKRLPIINKKKIIFYTNKKRRLRDHARVIVGHFVPRGFSRSSTRRCLPDRNSRGWQPFRRHVYRLHLPRAPTPHLSPFRLVTDPSRAYRSISIPSTCFSSSPSVSRPSERSPPQPSGARATGRWTQTHHPLLETIAPSGSTHRSPCLSRRQSRPIPRSDIVATSRGEHTLGSTPQT